MDNQESKIMFEISSELNKGFLQELYGDDFEQMEIVFEATVTQLVAEITLAQSRFHEGDVTGTRKVVHKMKPLFGYVGLDEIMAVFAAFEEKCLSGATITEVEQDFLNIVSITEDAVQKIEKELKRLKQFNTQYL